MNTAITSRDDLMLAKIAGEDVDIGTMTPPVVASPREYWMLKIAERLDGAVGGNPSAATTDKAGVVKMAANVPNAAGSAPTAAEFDALIAALVAAGIMAAPASIQS